MDDDPVIMVSTILSQTNHQPTGARGRYSRQSGAGKSGDISIVRQYLTACQCRGRLTLIDVRNSWGNPILAAQRWSRSG